MKHIVVQISSDVSSWLALRLRGRDYAFIIGASVQGFVIGLLLFVAICELIAAAAGVRLFRYQGF